jgi:tetratricopeptide (TPR) repeat protein
LAEFFQDTEVQDKQVLLGEVSLPDLQILQQNRLIPLPVLFKVDATSPYYHQEQKGDLFYAESWALTHYLEVADFKDHANRIGKYLQLVSKGMDSVTAAEQAFGDLKTLQKDLDDYARAGRYTYFQKSTAAAPLDEGSFAITPLTLPQADAIRADFLVHVGRMDDARALLDAALKADPNNVKAHEAMGLIEFRADHHDEAKKWYEEAVALDPQSYLAQYYAGSLAVMGGATTEAAQNSLRAAIKLNPRFAPAYDSLANLLARRNEKLEEAHMLELQAVTLDPTNLHYRLNTASILLEQDNYDSSVRVLQAARTMAKNPLEVDVVERMLKQVDQRRAQMEEFKRQQTEAQAHTTVVVQGQGASGNGAAAGATEEEPKLKHPTETPHGQMRVMRGLIRDVTCGYPAVMELRLETATKKLSFYSNNYYKVEYRAANFTPKGEVHPCQDLEGMKAEVEYFTTADKTVDGQIVGIMMIK